MSLTIIFVVLSIASAAHADSPGLDAHAPVKPHTPVEPATSTSCNILKRVNETHALSPADFKHTLETCSRDSRHNKDLLNFEASVLLQVFSAISVNSCSFTGHSDEESQLIDCVKKETKTSSFSVKNATSSFGMDNTFSLKFRFEECKKSVETSNCVEKVFSAEKLDAKMKVCKDNILRGFAETSKVCSDFDSFADDRGSGHAILPMQSLIFGSMLMIAKVIVSG